MASSSTEICNFALALVGQKRISDIDDDDTEDARLCKIHYDQTVDEELRAYQWNAAEAQKELSLEGATDKQPIIDYDFIWNLPNDPFCLRVLKVNDGNVDYRVVGRRLLTNVEDKLLLRYTKRITDIVEFDALLVRVIYTTIAIKISWPLTQSKTLKNDLILEYKQIAEPLAKFIDSAENHDTRKNRNQSGWEDSRVADRERWV